MKKWFFLVFSALLCACSIDEGEGGQASITGRVFIQEKVDFSVVGGPSDSVVNEYPGIEERVYIKYGDNSIYDDDFDTDENGFYKFTDLTKGNYTLFTYTKCDSCDSEVSPVYLKAKLEKHNSQLENQNFYIEKD